MKKLNQQGFTHHLLILGIAVVVVAAVGFTGWKVYQKNNGSSAKAYNWTGTIQGTAPYVCKTDLGSSWKIMSYYTMAGQGATKTYYWKVTGGSGLYMSGQVTPTGPTSNIHYQTVSKSGLGQINGAVSDLSSFLRGAAGSVYISNVKTC